MIIAPAPLDTENKENETVQSSIDLNQNSSAKKGTPQFAKKNFLMISGSKMQLAAQKAG